MRNVVVICVVALALAVSMPASAGEKHACKASTEDCMKKLQAKIQTKGWLGIEYKDTGDGHWAVKYVYPGSPAEQAGFEKGDILLAVNGVEMSEKNKEAYKKAVHTLGPGSKATYAVKRDGSKVKLAAKLDSVPRDVMAQWMGEHVLDSHLEVQMASK
jgi:predicted metalloprotease with PDZ domain